MAQQFRNRLLAWPALDALDRPNAEACQLRKLFLRPAPLQAQLLDEQGGVVSHGRRVASKRILDHVTTPTAIRLSADNAAWALRQVRN